MSVLEIELVPAGAVPYRQIRACYDENTITVYQAYKRSIASAAVTEQKLSASPQFRTTRMTWIKPSWAWMLYRAGYSYKDPGQERILALKMKHGDFIALLEQAVLTHGHQPDQIGDGEPGVGPEQAAGGKAPADESPKVKVQWDPERDVRLQKLDYRSIQIGIPGALSNLWVEEYIVGIEDVTDTARQLKKMLDEQPDTSDEELLKQGLMPTERPFIIPEALQRQLGMF